jgi:Ca2+-dependent lipid-binding protein
MLNPHQPRISRSNLQHITIEESLNESDSLELIKEKECVLQILVKDGKLFRNTETFGKMDPYVTFEYNGSKFRTSCKDDAG